MLRHLYSLSLLLATPVILLRLLLKSLSMADYRRNIGQRFGGFKRSQLPSGFSSGSPTIWIHAVSVGETVASAPLVYALQDLESKPNILFTTTTPTGSDRARALFGESVAHCYSPYDLGFVIRKFLFRMQPDVLILMETELWPNLIHYSHQRGTKILLANARLSERSAAGYGRVAGLSRAMLKSIDCIAAQAEADAERFISLGADQDRVSVTGSLKFNIEPYTGSGTEDPLFESIKASGRPVIIAASTRAGEEEKVISAFDSLWSLEQKPLLLLVPRHPERFDKVAKLCQDKALATQRRSSASKLETDTQVILGDSMGEMLAYYSLADIAFVGGSLVDTGCQNVLEPAAMGLPVLVGPSQYNFAAICSLLESEGALYTVADSQGLSEELLKLLIDDDRRKTMGDAGLRIIEENQQALPNLLARLKELLAEV